MADKLLKTLTIDGNTQIVDAVGWNHKRAAQTVNMSANTDTLLCSITLTEPGAYLITSSPHFKEGGGSNISYVASMLKVNGETLDDRTIAYWGFAQLSALNNLAFLTVSDTEAPKTVELIGRCEVARQVIGILHAVKLSNYVGGGNTNP